MSRRATTDEEWAIQIIKAATREQLDSWIWLATLAKEIRFGASVEPKRTRGPAKKQTAPLETVAVKDNKTE